MREGGRERGRRKERNRNDVYVVRERKKTQSERREGEPKVDSQKKKGTMSREGEKEGKQPRIECLIGKSQQ